MSFLDRCRAFLHPSPTVVRGSTVLLARLEALETELSRLTERELAHDVSWSEAKEQISRHLKRVAAIENRQGHGLAVDPIRQRLLDAKFHHNGGS